MIIKTKFDINEDVKVVSRVGEIVDGHITSVEIKATKYSNYIDITYTVVYPIGVGLQDLIVLSELELINCQK